MHKLLLVSSQFGWSRCKLPRVRRALKSKGAAVTSKETLRRWGEDDRRRGALEPWSRLIEADGMEDALCQGPAWQQVVSERRISLGHTADQPVELPCVKEHAQSWE